MMHQSKCSKRLVDGIILLNKPLGISSNQALQRVKRLYHADKAGHTGALDPLATGMLPICLGDATKFSQFLLDADKTYQVCAQLGVRTTTSDAAGEIVKTCQSSLTQTEVEQHLPLFRGVQQQVPSMYSALKYQGKPLYSYARAGVHVERASRPIRIYALDLLEFDPNKQQAFLNVHCSKGTYIRTLVDDLGETLGCGAHVHRLHRSHVADYLPTNMHTLEVLENLTEQQRDGLLLDLDTPIKSLPAVVLSSAHAKAIQMGQSIVPKELDYPCGQIVRLIEQQQEGQYFMGMGEVDAQGHLTAKKLRRIETEPS